MPQLDPLLQAVVERSGSELLLAEGQRPSILISGSERPVSQRSLTRPQIVLLLAELSSQIDRDRLASGVSLEFNYALNGEDFECAVGIEAGRWCARLTPSRVGSVPAAAAPAEAAPLSADTGDDSMMSNTGVALGSTPHAAPAMPDAAPTPSVPAPPAPTARPSAPKYTLRPDAPPLDRLLIEMLERGSSDLHLIAGDRPYYRVDGEMQAQASEPVNDSDAVWKLLEPITPDRNREEFQASHDTDFAYEIPDAARFRVNVFMDRHGVGAVFRQIPSKILTAEQLNLPPAILKMCDLHKGLVLVTGPTGSGKSTTLAAMIDYINKTRSDHIITIEDPIEFVHQNQRCLVNQREVTTHTEGFKKALRAALREDPDIVLVGELRDLETIAIAIETAETGHLVFGTLHTNTACSTVDRVIDQFPADRQAQIRVMLSESLRGVVAQTLLKKKGGGRVAGLEVLVVNSAISNLIREGKTFQIPSLMQTGKKLGMLQMNDALFDLVKNGLVEPDEALRKAIDRPALHSKLKSGGIKVAETAEG